jgi:type IV secretion system protein VirB10
MTFDPQSLYAKPEPGRGIRPIVFVAGGAALVAVIGGIVTQRYWWPDTPVQAELGAGVESSNSGSKQSPLKFQQHYQPAVFTPPAEPTPPPSSAPAAEPPPPAFVPPPRTGPVASGPPKKPGIPESERISSVVLEGTGPTAATPPASSRAPGSVQVADNRGGRDSFYSSAGQLSDAFKPTGIVGQLGRCALRPGSYIFHEATGVVSSDTPGQITARTSRPIYAGPKGDCYAAPAGATLVGAVNANTSYGEERLQVAWTALILPNGRMVDLGGMPGAGGNGATGLPADVNNHYGALAGAILVGTAVDVIRGLASFGGGRGGGGAGSDVVVNMGGSLADRSASVGERLVDRELNRRPTMTAKPEELTVQVTRPIELEPYKE